MKKSVIFFVGLWFVCANVTEGCPRLHRLDLAQSTPSVGPVRERPAMWSLDEDTLHNVDILSYQLSAEVDISTQLLDGHSTILLRALDDSVAETWMSFHALNIDSASAENHDLACIRGGNDSLTLIFEPALAPDETTAVDIFYYGHPEHELGSNGWGGFFFSSQVAFSMGDGLSCDPPPMTDYVMPCYLNPRDRATFETWWRVTSERVVSSNGILVDTVDHGDGTKTWHYRLDQPVATYLMSVAIGDYFVGVLQEEAPRIEYFVYPGYENRAETHFSNVPDIMEGYVALFGSFPFDRMSYAMTTHGDMEHVTCVHHHQLTVQGNHRYDWLLAHEMSHMWWGNWVTLGEWADLWLNEGFATFCEALAMEFLNGPEAYDDYIQSSIMSPYLSSGEVFPIYDPNQYWSYTVYEKGAAVMHMLRRLLGDSVFFAAWHSYGETYAFSNAVTADWQRELEDASGQDLDWFFEPWVYGWGYPKYYYSYWVDGDTSNLVHVRIRQAQTTHDYFRMPLELRFNYPAGWDTTVTLWNEAVDDQLLSVTVPDTFESVDFDPRNSILDRAWYEDAVAESGPVASSFRFCGAYPNPFNSQTVFEFELPKPADVHVRIYNLLGREVATLAPGVLQPGSGKIRWRADGLSSGIYIAAFEAGEFSAAQKIILLK